MYLGCEALCSQEALSRCIHLMHLDQARIPMYRWAAPWVVGDLKVVKTHQGPLQAACCDGNTQPESPSEQGYWCKHFSRL